MKAAVQEWGRGRPVGLLGDEIDMTQGPSACPSAINSIKSGLPQDGRLRFANYGKGVLNWGAIGYNGHNDTSSACFVNAQDVTSADLYWFTDPWQVGDPQSGQGMGLRLDHRPAAGARSLPARSKPVWAVIELGHPFSEADWPTIAPAQVRAAVWQSLIAGARGIHLLQPLVRRSEPIPAHPPRWLRRRLRLRANPVRGNGHQQTDQGAGPGPQLPNGQLRLVCGAWHDRDGEVGERARSASPKKKECRKARKRNCRQGDRRQLYVFAGSAGSSVHGEVFLAVCRQSQGFGGG